MKIHFRLGWVKTSKAGIKSFKTSAPYELFFEYAQRISNFVPCEVSGFEVSNFKKQPALKLWVCDRGTDARIFSSEQTANNLKKALDSGTRELVILIGGPNGFTTRDFEILKPEMKWSFGPMTLPHELASVVACEQIYRAFAILNHLPYHLGH